jgi:hypothetical protein
VGRCPHPNHSARRKHSWKNAQILENASVWTPIHADPLWARLPPIGRRHKILDVEKIKRRRVRIAYVLEVRPRVILASRVEEFDVVASLRRVVCPDLLYPSEDVRIWIEHFPIAQHAERGVLLLEKIYERSVRVQQSRVAIAVEASSLIQKLPRYEKRDPGEQGPDPQLAPNTE